MEPQTSGPKWNPHTEITLMDADGTLRSMTIREEATKSVAEEPEEKKEGEEEAMGTFTISYFAKKVFWEHKFLCLWVPAAYYFGTCWDRAGMHKASMMKGHSRMYADRIQAIPKNDDVWKY
ncbi:hypothetical protein QR680_005029 [Steinernema hermaphroditum]|uniref:Uncharacterized protein n=1 Tax=Steinernema hermaphroditum TaxID=289476 RepID=A0AA39HQM1_9BILA|nr:hypothetical protein QR680_005029 [Steinernema hermaphroditum]